MDWAGEPIALLTGGMEHEVVHALARAFAANPLHVVLFGRDEIAANEVFFRLALITMTGERRIIVDRKSDVVGFVHWNASPHCQPSWSKKLQLAASMARTLGLRKTANIAAWQAAWSKHDPKKPHVHLGPIGVIPEARGAGLGRQLMKLFCDELDRRAAVGYLETDRAENVTFYSKSGFDVTGTEQILGVTNYFMRRPATTRVG